MKTREEALRYGSSFPDTYQEAPFHDPNWQLVRVKKSKKAFLWTYEKDGYININLKVDAEWRDLWRKTYKAVLPAYHQNKEHWNTVILDGSIPDDVINFIKIPIQVRYLVTALLILKENLPESMPSVEPGNRRRYWRAKASKLSKER